jgi:hypothetical protein
VDLGVLTVDKAVPDSADAEKKLLFLPGQLTDGIKESDDPLIDIRDGAYALSFSRRNPRLVGLRGCAGSWANSGHANSGHRVDRNWCLVRYRSSAQESPDVWSRVGALVSFSCAA